MFIAGVLFTVKCNWVENITAKEYFHEGASSSVAPGTPPSFAELAKRVGPAVVNISTTKKMTMKSLNPFKGFGREDPFNDFFDKFFDGVPPQQREQHSLGSGFIINESGYILTNNHVVAEADEILVRLSDKQKFPAKIVGTDAKTDVAVIKIESSKPLPFETLGDSEKLQVGDWVMAVGNPFALSHTVTAGIVSAKGRVIGAGPYDNFIQTDASINPGNSGGPLFNLAGEVVGINTAIFAGGQGLGFAIPINMAKNLIPQLVEKGKVTDRGWLGIQMQDISEELAKSFGLDEPKGALVGDVVPGSPAEKAGIKRGDIVLKFDDKDIEKFTDLPGLVAGSGSGKTVKLEILRDSKKQTVDVTLGKMPSEDELAATPRDEKGNLKKADVLGLVVKIISMEEAHNLGVPQGKGILIARVEPASSAEGADVRSGDVLLEVNGKSTNSVEDYNKAVAGLKKGNIVRLLIKRANATLYVAFKV